MDDAESRRAPCLESIDVGHNTADVRNERKEEKGATAHGFTRFAPGTLVKSYLKSEIDKINKINKINSPLGVTLTRVADRINRPTAHVKK